ncbi:MAG: oxygenase MpaB family protein [Nitrospirales bacterium]
MIDLDNQHETKWSDDHFLDGLRLQGDVAADQCIIELQSQLKEEDFSELFQRLNTNNVKVDENIPDPLKRFLTMTMHIPLVDSHPVDEERLRRGQQVFMTHALPSALVLLVKSLPEGYAAPSLSKVLCISSNLSQRPYRRLLGVLQMVINVSAVGGFDPTGKALVTVPKIRLLHASIRKLVREHLGGYEQQYGTPVNCEDMLGTVMGFSYLVIAGLKQLKIGLRDDEAEDLYYLWRIFAQMMGIHPEGQPDSSEYVPRNLTEAKMFYDSYRRRQYVQADENPEGVELAATNLRMMSDLLPQTPLRRLGMHLIPKMYMEELIGQEGCRRIGIRPVRFLYLTKWLVTTFPSVWSRLWNVVDRVDTSHHFHENMSRVFFQGLINREFDGEITFQIPDTLEELNKLA